MERVGLGFEEKLNALLAEAKKKKNVLDYPLLINDYRPLHHRKYPLIFCRNQGKQESVKRWLQLLPLLVKRCS